MKEERFYLDNTNHIIDLDSSCDKYAMEYEEVVKLLNNLWQENKQLKEQVVEQIDYKDEYYHYWQETKKENTILKEALKETEEIVRKTLDYYLHRMSFDDIQKDDLQYNYWSKKAKKCEDIIKVIEQAKEIMK